MIQLAVKDIEKSFSVYQILKGASFEVQDNERVGLVGKNGTGKTTLLKMIMGIEDRDKGDIFIKKGAKLGYVEQIPHFDEGITVKDVLKTAFKSLQDLSDQMQQLEKEMVHAEGDHLERNLRRYGELSEQFERQGGYEIEENLSKVCSGLRFTESFLDKRFMSLSGGEKTTVLLGKVLLEQTDILLLDEPTNHLDLHAMEWLEGYLHNYKGAVLMISHDRYFLDQVATKIVELDRGKAFTFYGNYSYYVEEKERMLLVEFEAYEDQQKKIKAMEKAIKRLRIWAAQGDNEDLFKKAACMQRRLDKMEKLEKPMLEAPQIALHFNETERSGKDVLRLCGVTKAFPDKVLFNELDFTVNYKERIALIGDNGCGKSTLIKMILGEEKEDLGEICLGTRLKIAYLPQQVYFENEELTVLETFKQDVVMTETKARQTLAKFLFYGEEVFKKVKGLSGGEKSRLMLCKLIQEDVNLLILDEPTNHLDIDSRENLEEALQSFKGTLLFISHDRYFINKVAERVSEVSHYRITDYNGNYDYYKEKAMQKSEVLKREKLEEISGKIEHIPTKGKNELLKENELVGRKQSVETKKKQMSKISASKLKRLEEHIQKTEEVLSLLDKEMENVGSDYTRYMVLEAEKDDVQKQLDELMEEWVAHQEVIESEG